MRFYVEYWGYGFTTLPFPPYIVLYNATGLWIKSGGLKRGRVERGKGAYFVVRRSRTTKYAIPFLPFSPPLFFVCGLGPFVQSPITRTRCGTQKVHRTYTAFYPRQQGRPWGGGQSRPLGGVGWEHGGDGRNRTGVRGFADPCLSHSATSPQERVRGFEPPTFSLARRRSTTELHPLILPQPTLIIYADAALSTSCR